MRRWMLVWFLACPAWARLFFYLPETRTLEPGDVRLDFGAVYGNYILVSELEDRWYAPDLRAHAQLYPRLAISLETFGIYRSEEIYKQPAPLEEGAYGGGDYALAVFLDLKRATGRGWGLKPFFKVKFPNANLEDGFGSDRTDTLVGLSGDWRSKRFSFSGVARLDVIGRPNLPGQWDYVTLGARVGWLAGNRLTVMVEGWRRDRGDNSTSLYSAGLDLKLSPKWTLEALAGDGDHEFYETNLDSRIRRQYSLRLKWRFQSKKMTRWLNQI